MKFESKIGPMVCLKVKRLIKNEQNEQSYSMKYYKILFQGATMGATQLHAFKVIRNGEELYLPTHMLKPGDNIWIDQSAFIADGSLQFFPQKETKECLPEGTKVLTPIENIVIAEGIVHFQVGTVSIQANNDHPINIKRGDKISAFLRADELRAGDMFISLLSPGNKVFGADGKCHSIYEYMKGANPNEKE